MKQMIGQLIGGKPTTSLSYYKLYDCPLTDHKTTFSCEKFNKACCS